MVNLHVGSTVPRVRLGKLNAGRVDAIDLQSFCTGRTLVFIGVPGAFTPVCSKRHLPGYVDQAPSLRRSGIDEIVCIAPNDPWSVEEWSRQLDPENRLCFVSDGNREFADATGLTMRDTDNFLGRTLRRFVMLTIGGVVKKLASEPDSVHLTCTAADQTRFHET